MSILKRNLDIRTREDREELLRILKSVGIDIDDAALLFAIETLSGDWCELKTLDLCPLRVGGGSIYAIDLITWSRVVGLIYDFRNHKDFGEQIRRMGLDSHEKLDTILVILVAGRYQKYRFEITFEPNGNASTDLLICRDACRLYLEVKRENVQEHTRHQRMLSLSGAVSDQVATDLKEWLRENGLRIEIKFSMLFSDEHVQNVVQEIEAKANAAPVGAEQAIACVRNSTFITLPRDAAFFYEKGLHTGTVRVEKAGTPVQAFAPTSMPVRCTYDARPNLDALGERVRDAGQQLRRDLDKDPKACGFVVLESLFGGEKASEAIRTRFWARLPGRCLGVALISNPTFAIPRADLKSEYFEILKIAATAD